MKMECKLFDLDLDKLSLAGEDRIREVICNKRKMLELKRQAMKLIVHGKPRLAGTVNGLRIDAFLGSGRFGSAHHGLKLEFNHKIVIKEYHAMFNETIVQALEQGTPIRQLIFLRHPFIVKTFAVSNSDTIYYSIVERAQRSIQEEVVETGKISEERAKVLMWQVVRAVEFLHSKDIVHGSLHTRNMLLFPEDIVKISDHVTTQLITQIPVYETPLAIIRFWAPELLQGAMTSTRTDIWALGVSLYTILTESYPFAGADHEEVQYNIENGIWNIPSDISDNLKKVLGGMLEPNKSKRLTANNAKNQEWLTVESELLEPMGARHELLVEQILEQKKAAQPQILMILPEICPADSNNNDEVNTVIEDSEESKGSDNVQTLEQTPPVPKRYYEKFTVFVVENVREEWDPTVMRLDKCTMKIAGKETPCLRIVLPHIEQPKPSFFKRLKLRMEKTMNRLHIDPQEEFDYNHGDYCLMEFTRTRMAIEPYENVIHFPNRRIAGNYYYKEHADRLWDHCGVVVCMNCRRMRTDSEKHGNERCLYKLWKDATVCEEVLFMGDEDRFHIRSFNMVYRTDGGRKSFMTRFCRGSKRIFNERMDRIRNTFSRRQIQN